MIAILRNIVCSALRFPRKILLVVMLGGIKFWQSAISPLAGSNCRFYPSCSAYAQEALLRDGIVRGVLKSAWRILRCNSLSAGGYDPVQGSGTCEGVCGKIPQGELPAPQ